MCPKFITLTKRAKDITGQRFGRWVALGPIGRSPDNAIVWLCLCDCGRTVSVYGDSLRKGKSRSCGCLGKEKQATRQTTHGMSDSPLYFAWANMIQRCINPKNASYSNYGERGIGVCGEWQNSFESFCGHVAHLPNFGIKGYSLDRIDNSGNYEPGNVQWSSISEQNRNTRQTHLITYHGKTQCMRAWAKELAMNENTLKNRLRKGWDIERALTTRVR